MRNEVPLAYLPGGLTRLTIKVVGQLADPQLRAHGAAAPKQHAADPLPADLACPDDSGAPRRRDTSASSAQLSETAEDIGAASPGPSDEVELSHSHPAATFTEDVGLDPAPAAAKDSSTWQCQACTLCTGVIGPSPDVVGPSPLRCTACVAKLPRNNLILQAVSDHAGRDHNPGCRRCWKTARG